jgi:hypothetical protein
MGAEQSAAGAPHFRVPSSEFRAPRWGGWQTSEFRVKKKDRGWQTSEFRVKKKDRGWQTSEFRVKKKERKKDRGWQGATRGLEVERRTRNWAIRVQFPPGAK